MRHLDKSYFVPVLKISCLDFWDWEGVTSGGNEYLQAFDIFKTVFSAIIVIYSLFYVWVSAVKHCGCFIEIDLKE